MGPLRGFDYFWAVGTLRAIFDLYISASVHVALAVVCLLCLTVLQFETTVPPALYWFVFFGTVSGYNFVKYAMAAGLQHLGLGKRLRVVQVFSFVCTAMCAFFGFQLAPPVLVTTAGFAVLTLFYALPLYRSKTLRTVPGLKIFVVATVWAGVTVVLPCVAASVTFTAGVWLTFVQRFLTVLVLTLPFELRDLQSDTLHLGTLPQKWGVGSTKTFGGLCLLVTFGIEFFKEGTRFAQTAALLVMCLLTGAALLCAKKRQPRYYSSFWVEGLPAVWLATVVLLGRLFL